MDEHRFDALARALGAGGSRRRALGLLAGAAVSLAGVAEDVAAGHGRRTGRGNGRGDSQARAGSGHGNAKVGDRGRNDAVRPAKKKKKCKGGTVRCGRKCVSLLVDPAHCGGCDSVCVAGQRCQAGHCTCGGSSCGGCCDGNSCQPGSDLSACGGNGAACAVCATGATCDGSGCVCPGDELDCNGSCVDRGTDAAHCGACGNACDPDDVCCAGSCASLGSTANCGACGRACEYAEQVCCDGACTMLGTTARCASCDDACAVGESCCGGACARTDTVRNCGACGTLCPGAGAPFAEPVCLNGDTCGIVCQGDHYDVDGNPDNGCEVSGGVANHTMETAATATPATQGCDDAVTGGFIGMIASDGRAHSPAVEGLDPVTGAAPQWWKVRATGGQCVRDLSVELTMSRATRNCYRLTVTTDKGEVSAVWNGGIEVTGTGTGAYTPDTDIHVKMEKFCSVTTVREAAVYSVSSHL